MRPNDEEASKEYLLPSSPTIPTPYSPKHIPLSSPRRWSRWLPTTLAIILAVELFYVSTILTLNLFIQHRITSSSPSQLQSGEHHHEDSVSEPHYITDGALRYELRNEWVMHQHPWNLPPGQKLDDAWEDLLVALNVRITPSEMHHIGANTTNRAQLSNGDYLGVLGAYHNLHCLDTIRRLLHWEDYYKENMQLGEDDVARGDYTLAHADHCINGLRQALICHASTAVYTFEWKDASFDTLRENLAVDTQTKCLDWGSLDTWARKRALRKGGFRYLASPFKGHGERGLGENNFAEGGK